MADYKSLLQQINKGEWALKPKQLEILDKINKGEKEIVGILPTGYGKSLIFEIAPLLLKGTVLVFSPLSVIQSDQLDRLKDTNLRSCILNVQGRVTMNLDEEEEVKDLKCSVPVENINDCDIIFAHPESFFDTAEGKTLLDSDRGEKFRKSFKRLKDLPAFFPGVPRVALSATVTVNSEKEILDAIGFSTPSIVKKSPNRPNIFLSKVVKQSPLDPYESYQAIYKPLCETLKQEQLAFPVTLLYMPLQYIGDASAYCRYIFNSPKLEEAMYGAMCSGQNDEVKSHIVSELQKENPNIRLIFCTSVVGMGFNSPSVSRVVHSKPPKNMQDYVQEIGRAGRKCQSAEAILHYSPRDISCNIKDMNKDMIGYCNEDKCLREYMLRQFGFPKSEEVCGQSCCQFCRESCCCVECEMMRIEL